MRIMAFDYGTRRLGIAVTDPLQIIATGLKTIHPDDVVDFLNGYLATEQVELFVVGEPLQTDGTPSQIASQVAAFISTLKTKFPAIPVKTVDERFTSKMASAVLATSGLKKSARQDKGRVDRIAATLILQTYLETKTVK